MTYECYYCKKSANHHDDTAHSITLYDKDGLEEDIELLCNECYSDWLLSLKG